MNKLGAEDRRVLIHLAASLGRGSEYRRAILGGLKIAAEDEGEDSSSGGGGKPSGLFLEFLDEVGGKRLKNPDTDREVYFRNLKGPKGKELVKKEFQRWLEKRKRDEGKGSEEKPKAEEEEEKPKKEEKPADTRPRKKNWRGDMARPHPETVSKVKEKLEGLQKGKIRDPWDQFSGDPDLEEIMEKGEEQSGKGAIKKYMADGECHWNTAKLLNRGEVDEIVIGYAHTPEDGWHQHTWGRKDGEIVETTRGNASATTYFGLPLKGDEAKDFAKWALDHPPGGGVVRKVKAALLRASKEEKKDEKEPTKKDFEKGVSLN